MTAEPAIAAARAPAQRSPPVNTAYIGPVPVTLHIAQDPEADSLLSRDPFALLVGMLLDQQVRLEVAFAGPARLAERFGSLDPAAIVAADPEAFADLAATAPAIHRYARSMAGRIQALAAHVIENYDGDTEAIWNTAPDAAELVRRLRALPGFGEQKARIFAALLGKQLGVQPAGWRAQIGPYAEPGTFRSVADVVDPESLAKVRETKQQAKLAAKDRATRKGVARD